ncbi:hypothetical protein KIL84_002414 [Mauremys mutica]|uniref:Uncharacterized protein n=1 Tax=Mauremys mutica TaxID=74926 RepID=A0A9D4AZ95_9SAUR|nr:hypothetical protein KIL84_002414 [Mauremys mutica]
MATFPFAERPALVRKGGSRPFFKSNKTFITTGTLASPWNWLRSKTTFLIRLNPGQGGGEFCTQHMYENRCFRPILVYVVRRAQEMVGKRANRTETASSRAANIAKAG